MPFDTELTRQLAIRIPVVQGGMQWVGYAELASAVSNAGGLGIACFSYTAGHYPWSFFFPI